MIRSMTMLPMYLTSTSSPMKIDVMSTWIQRVSITCIVLLLCCLGLWSYRDNLDVLIHRNHHISTKHIKDMEIQRFCKNAYEKNDASYQSVYSIAHYLHSNTCNWIIQQAESVPNLWRHRMDVHNKLGDYYILDDIDARSIDTIAYDLEAMLHQQLMPFVFQHYHIQDEWEMQPNAFMNANIGINHISIVKTHHNDGFPLSEYLHSCDVAIIIPLSDSDRDRSVMSFPHDYVAYESKAYVKNRITTFMNPTLMMQTNHDTMEVETKKGSAIIFTSKAVLSQESALNEPKKHLQGIKYVLIVELGVGRLNACRNNNSSSLLLANEHHQQSRSHQVHDEEETLSERSNHSLETTDTFTCPV